MRFDTTRCLGCGHPMRPTDLNVPPQYADHIQPDGEVSGTDFWFHSIECYEEAFSKYLDKKYALDKKPSDDPDLDKLLDKVEEAHGDIYEGEDEKHERRHQDLISEGERFYRQWYEDQKTSIDLAQTDLTTRLLSEANVYDAKKNEEERKVWEKEQQVRDMAEATKPHDLSIEPITDEHRFEHSLIVSASGGGKTTLMESQILEFLKRPDPPGLVVIDPKGLCVGRLQKLALFDPDNGRLRDRLIIVDPSHTPALNMFDARGLPINENQLVDIYQYMFASKDNAITPKMTTMFTFLIRLLSTMRQATIHDLLDICDDRARSLNESKFAPNIRQLDRTAIRFFENDYYAPKSDYSSTRDQVKQRLYNIIGVREIDAAFSAPERKVDMVDALKNRKIVLVNADIDLLGEDGSQLWGRAILGLTLAATYARGKIPRSHWHETFVFMDEAQLFVEEEKTPRFLQLAREYRVGITHALQDFSPLTAKVQSSMSANTAIKYAAGVGGDDLSYIARDLHCDPAFIRAQRKTATHAMFACFVRNLMKNPASVSVAWQPLARESQMSDAQHKKLVARNRALFSASKTHEGPTAVEPSREKSMVPAEADTKIVARKDSDPSASAKWVRPR